MWSDEFEKLTAYEKGEFKRTANILLSHTYMVRFKYDTSKQTILADNDYRFVSDRFSLFYDYFIITGWRLEKDANYGIISLKNEYGSNRLRLDKFTTLFLYTCRLIYEEKREQENGFHIVKTDTEEIVSKMRSLGLLEKGKSTQRERRDAQSTLAYHNIIQKTENTAWSSDGNGILILPSVLTIITNEGINEMIDQLEEMKIDGDAGADEETADEMIEEKGDEYETDD